MIRKTASVAVVAGLLLSCGAIPASALQLSLGVRETATGGGAEVAIGGDGGSAGGIEWINRDALNVPLDNQWHRYAWDLDADPATAFAGITANSILEGAYGTIEHLRFLNETGVTAPITVWIDYVVNTFGPGPVVVQDFEGFANGAEVMFQEPSFSGSTASNVAPGSTSVVDDSTAFNGLASYRVSWTFVDNGPTRWVRLTTFGTPNQPNPLIRFDQNSVVSLYVKAVPEPATAAMLLVGGWLMIVRRRGSQPVA
jgi:hypothetical protein